jgi:hypothetical protein
MKTRTRELPVMLVGGHVSALPERTLHEESADFACKGEGPVTVVRLLEEISGGFPDLAAVPGLVWRGEAGPVVNQPARLIEDLDCRPLLTAYLSPAEILALRDEAFHAYFGSRRYLDMVSQRLGQEARAKVEGMSSRRQRRRLLDQQAA